MFGIYFSHFCCFDNIRFVARACMRARVRACMRTCTWAQVGVSGRAVPASERARFAYALPFFIHSVRLDEDTIFARCFLIRFCHSV